jgi:hypothetical protein
MRGTGIANSFRGRVCPRRCSAGILSERDGARAGEENEGHYGRCDFAVHDALLMISRMRRPASKDNALCRASCRGPDHVIEDECFTIKRRRCLRMTMAEGSGAASDQMVAGAVRTAHVLADGARNGKSISLPLAGGNVGAPRCVTTAFTTSKRGLRKSAIS